MAGPKRPKGQTKTPSGESVTSGRSSSAWVAGGTAAVAVVGLAFWYHYSSGGGGAGSLPPPGSIPPPSSSSGKEPLQKRPTKADIFARLQKNPHDLVALFDLCELYEDDFSRAKQAKGPIEEPITDVVGCYAAAVDVLTVQEQIDTADRIRAAIAADKVLAFAQGRADRLETAAKGLTLLVRSNEDCDAQPRLMPFGSDQAESCVRAAAKLRSALKQLGQEPAKELWSGSKTWANGQPHLQLPGIRARPFWKADEVPWLQQHGRTLADAVQAEWPLLRDAKWTDFMLIAEEPGNWRGHTLFINNEWDDNLCGLCPRICTMLKSVGALDTRNAHLEEGVTFPELLVSFFSLEPGGRILPHFGTHGRVIASIGVSGFEETDLVVGGETRKWSATNWVVFDDAFEHSVTNKGTTPRIVFSVSSVHPDLLAAVS